MRIFFHRLTAIVLLLFGVFAAFHLSKKGYDLEYGEEAMVFFLAYLAIIYPAYMALFKEVAKKRAVKSKFISNVKDLKKELKTLEGKENKELINVQVIDRRNIVIIYKE